MCRSRRKVYSPSLMLYFSPHSLDVLLLLLLIFFSLFSILLIRGEQKSRLPQGKEDQRRSKVYDGREPLRAKKVNQRQESYPPYSSSLLFTSPYLPLPSPLPLPYIPILLPSLPKSIPLRISCRVIFHIEESWSQSS